MSLLPVAGDYGGFLMSPPTTKPFANDDTRECLLYKPRTPVEKVHHSFSRLFEHTHLNKSPQTNTFDITRQTLKKPSTLPQTSTTTTTCTSKTKLLLLLLLLSIYYSTEYTFHGYAHTVIEFNSNVFRKVYFTTIVKFHVHTADILI